jgi:hypothetical protein
MVCPWDVFQGGAFLREALSPMVSNGLGDRLQQVFGGVTTHFVLDLNNSLSQVLSDGSNTYLYGLDRIAQQNVVGWQYFLGDARGSERQLVNPVGTMIQARSYEPFVKFLSTAGNPLTKYGYTGEWTNPTNLIYLRARYCSIHFSN